MDQLAEATSVSVAATEETPLPEAQKDWRRVVKELGKQNPKIENI